MNAEQIKRSLSFFCVKLGSDYVCYLICFSSISCSFMTVYRRLPQYIFDSIDHGSFSWQQFDRNQQQTEILRSNNSDYILKYVQRKRMHNHFHPINVCVLHVLYECYVCSWNWSQIKLSSCWRFATRSYKLSVFIWELHEMKEVRMKPCRSVDVIWPFSHTISNVPYNQIHAIDAQTFVPVDNVNERVFNKLSNRKHSKNPKGVC